MSNKKEVKIAIPFEWMAEKTLGPTFGELGKDLKNLYKKGRDKLIEKAYKKINEKDGKVANLRVARDTIFNGSFSDEDICTEYFGGVLASSRSKDGKDDKGIFYLNIIKSLSSSQLHLHYLIYNSLNKLLLKNHKRINIFRETEVCINKVLFSYGEFCRELKMNLDTDFPAIYQKGLLKVYEYDGNNIISIVPTTLGIILYMVAQNKFDDMGKFCEENIGDFENIELPKKYDLEELQFVNISGLYSYNNVQR